MNMDTVTKTLAVEMDGKKLSNVESVHICNTAMYGYSEPSDVGQDDEDTFCIDICMADRSREDMSQHTRITANGKGNRFETALEDAILAFLEK